MRPEKGGRKVRLSSDFLQWYRESGRRLGLDVAALNTSSRAATDPFACLADVNLPITRRELNACTGKTPTRRSGLAKRLDWVARLLGLPEREAAVLGAVVRLTGLGAFREFRFACSGEPVESDEVKAGLAARVCGLGAHECRKLFAPTGVLRQPGLLEDRRGGDWAPSRTLLHVLGQAVATEGQFIRAARLGSGTGAVAAAQGLLKAMGRKAQPELPAPTATFNPALSAADCDIVELERRVVAAGPVALSFLLSGPPGTGKSLFARRLAEKLGLEVLEKRGSDLLDKYVGGTEANIAAAFAEAAEGQRFLVFDEVDSLLFDRRGAQRNWEVSQVNEMLQAMERHPLPFACTTNFAENLDPATLRRFLFKVRFGTMSGEQARLAFRQFFGCPAPLGVSRLDPLTPGNFAVVAKKAKVLGERDPLRLLAMLRAEVEAKPGGSLGPVGFIQ